MLTRAKKREENRFHSQRRQKKTQCGSCFLLSGPCTVFVTGTLVHHMVLEKVNSGRCFSCLTCQPASGELGVSCRRRAFTKPEWKKPTVSRLFCVLLDYNSNHDNVTDERTRCFSSFQRQTRRLPIVSGARRCENVHKLRRLRYRGQVLPNTGLGKLPKRGAREAFLRFVAFLVQVNLPVSKMHK